MIDFAALKPKVCQCLIDDDDDDDDDDENKKERGTKKCHKT